MTPAAVALAHPLTPEDRSRCEFYALLARLYADPPDANLLKAIAAAEPMDGESHLTAAWNRLVDASGAMDADAAAQEYTELFIGVGRSEVNLHASHWLTGFMMEKPLAELRTALAGLGLARRANVVMLEDHLSALFETMRLLIAGQDERLPASVADAARSFSSATSRPWIFPCCDRNKGIRYCQLLCLRSKIHRKYVALDRDALAME